MAAKRTLLQGAPTALRQTGVPSYQKSSDQIIISILLSTYLYIIYVNLYSPAAIPEADPFTH
jgi:hypothetical protein